MPRVKTNIGTRAFHSCVSLLIGTTSHCISIQLFQLLPPRASQDISLTWPFPIDTSTPNDLLMLWKCFNNFAVEHWSAVGPLSLALPRILALYKFDRLIDWSQQSISRNEKVVPLNLQLLIMEKKRKKDTKGTVWALPGWQTWWLYMFSRWSSNHFIISIFGTSGFSPTRNIECFRTWPRPLMSCEVT